MLISSRHDWSSSALVCMMYGIVSKKVLHSYKIGVIAASIQTWGVASFLSLLDLDRYPKAGGSHRCQKSCSAERRRRVLLVSLADAYSRHDRL